MGSMPNIVEVSGRLDVALPRLKRRTRQLKDQRRKDNRQMAPKLRGWN